VLRVSSATIYALVKRGELVATRVGLSVRISAESLTAFLSQ